MCDCMNYIWVDIYYMHLWSGHEDDMVIELANEVRNILGKVGKGVILKEKKKPVGSTTHLPFMSFISGVQVHPLAEAAVAVAMDS